MIAVSEEQDAWCPPTLSPSREGLRWLALWIVQDASHSTLRSSAARIARRSAGGLSGSDAISAGRLDIARSRLRRNGISIGHPRPNYVAKTAAECANRATNEI